MMKTLSNHLILYDAECPMCTLYTKAFTKTGMLDADGRAPYQDMPAAVCPYVDKQRAVNEIALVNKQTGEVSYGIVSLFKIIANTFPMFRPLFLFKPFVGVMSKVYAFVSYNRKVIIPAPYASTAELQPTFKLKYRLAYLLFSWAIVGYVLTLYARSLTGVIPPGGAWREYLICGGQIIFQGVIVSLLNTSKRWDYLGNMMTISLAGSLLLLPALFVGKLLLLAPIFYAACFMGVAGLMFIEHIRRSKLLGLGWPLTISWVVYRLLVLAIILKLS